MLLCWVHKMTMINFDLDSTLISSMCDPRPGFGTIINGIKSIPNVSMRVYTASDLQRALNFLKRIGASEIPATTTRIDGVAAPIKIVDLNYQNISVDDRSEVLDVNNAICLIVAPYGHLNACLVKHRYVYSVDQLETQIALNLSINYAQTKPEPFRPFVEPRPPKTPKRPPAPLPIITDNTYILMSLYDAPEFSESFDSEITNPETNMPENESIEI